MIMNSKLKKLYSESGEGRMHLEEVQISSYKEAYQKHLNQETRVMILSDTGITLPPKTVQFITPSSKGCKLSEPNR